MAAVYIGLVHYPIYNKNQEVITTAITNLDIHDIARTARTYHVKRYFLIHPQPQQAALAGEIIDYWRTGYGGAYNPDRKEAFEIVRLLPDLDAAVRAVAAAEGAPPFVVTTDARKYGRTAGYGAIRRKIADGARPCLLLFGTGWGIEKATMEQFDAILEPIHGPGDYNHLPVRSAVAVILDRLLGEAWWDAEK